MDRKQEKLLEFILGSRSQEGIKKWNSLPPVYRQCAVCYTDFLGAVLVFFRRVIRVGKDSGLTNHIENLITAYANGFLV